MAKHVYYKKSKRLYLPFVGKMDKQAQLQRKREQRHRRETSGRLDKSISEYVQHKYPSIYAESKEHYDELNFMYPSKKANNKQMELKIQLMRSKKTTTTTTEIIESSSTASNEIITEPNEISTSSINDETSTSVNGITSPVNKEIITEPDELDLELDEIRPFINEEIPPQYD